MALFKILKGDSSRISTETTPFHEGYTYLTPDGEKFYIDAPVGSINERICINPASKVIFATLEANGWSNGKQVLSIAEMEVDTNGIIGVAQTITDAQLEAAKAAELSISAQGVSTITIAASGDVPTCDIPIIVILMP